MSNAERVPQVAAGFAVRGELVTTELFGRGHIHDSYALRYQDGNSIVRYLLQRVNETVFRRPELVMANIERVTEHVRAHLLASGAADADRRTLRLIRTHEGKSFHIADDGSYWRLYPFIEGTYVRESVETPAQAEQAGRAYGEFQRLLSDLGGPRLHETIPDFHNTPLRFEALERAIATDPCQRVSKAEAEIDLARRHRQLAGVLLDLHRGGEIPERVVHNDAKLSNVLFDSTTGEALCVVDLDTVMPGLSLYDFGDMVRSMTSRSAEDETDLAKVLLDLPLFEALARGYLQTAGEFLTPAERRHLVTAGKLITLEQGVRFLTDFLEGDVYYRTARPGHNLDRCRTQFKLLKSLERNEAQLNRILAEL